MTIHSDQALHVKSGHTWQRGQAVLPESVTDSALLDHIASLPNARATFKQLVREPASKAIARRVGSRAGRADRARRPDRDCGPDHFAATAAAANTPSGRLNMHRDGYGFLIPDRPIEGLRGDIFIPPRIGEGAMHGDRVVVRIARIERGRARRRRDRARSCGAPTRPWWASSALRATRACSLSRTTSASSSGSRSRRAWKFRPPSPPSAIASA